MSKVQVKYIGAKPVQTDTQAGTGVKWYGHGDVQPVPLAAWAKLAKHPAVWELVDALPVDMALEAAGLAAVAPLALAQSDHPEAIEVADGVTRPREDVVRETYEALVFGVKQWNELGTEERTELVDAHVARTRSVKVETSDKPPADFKADQAPAGKKNAGKKG